MAHFVSDLPAPGTPGGDRLGDDSGNGTVERLAVVPSLIITDNSKQTGAVAIGLSDSAYTQDYGLAFAEVFILALIPALLIFFGQRSFTHSLSHTGGK